MEQLLLRAVLFRHELHVVHDEEIVLSVFLFESFRLARGDVVDALGDESLCGEIVHFPGRIELLELVPYRLREVSLAAPGFSVDEERIVGDPRTPDDCLRRSIRELVECSDDERIECVAGVEVVALVDIELVQWKFGDRRRFYFFGLPALILHDLIFNIAVLIRHAAHYLEEQGMEFLQIPIAEELARYAHMNDAILYLHDLALAEPRIEVCGGYGELYLRKDVLPELARIQPVHSGRHYTRVGADATHCQPLGKLLVSWRQLWT